MEKNIKKLLVGLVAFNVLASVPLTSMTASAEEVKLISDTKDNKQSRSVATVNLVDVSNLGDKAKLGYGPVSNAVTLTQDGVFANGYIATKEKINLKNSFTLTTTFGIGGGASKADGISFFMQNAVTPTFGVGGDAMRINGISNTLGIAFRHQTWYSPARNNVSFYTKETGFFDYTNSFSSGNNLNLIINWDGPRQTLTYNYNGIVRSYRVTDMNKVFGGTEAIIGFTGVVGQGSNTHVLYNPVLSVNSGNDPIINATDKTIKVGESFSPLSGVSATDIEDGDITNKIQVISNDVNIEKPGDYAVVYSVTDSNSNTIIKSIKVKVEIPAPKLSNLDDKSTFVTVKGIPDADTTVILPDGTRIAKIANAQGEVTFAVSGLKEGDVVRATQTLNGQTSPVGSTVVQGSALDAPTITPVKVGDTSVIIQGVPGATIQFTDMNGDVTSKVANANGEATFYIPEAKVNDVFTATQTGANGKISASATYKVVDTSTPAAPTVNPIQDTDTTVTGNGAPNATIEVTIGDKVYTGTTDKDGHFTITIPKQSGGTKVDVVVINPNNGNASTPTQVTVQDTTLGAPDISGIKTGDTVVNVTGAPNAAVTLTLPNGTTLTQTADATGKATFTVPTAKAGEVYKATQTGANGKASPQTSTTVATNQLNAPTIDKYVVGESYVTGKAPAGAKKIALYKDGVLVRYGAVDADGTYKIWGKDALPTVGQVFDVYAVDIAGDLSKKATSTVLPGKSEVTVAPTIDPYTVGDSYVTGKIGANTKKVALYTNGQFVRYGAVDADGTYKIWGKDVLTVVNQAFEARPVDANGLEGPKANATVKGKDAIKVGAPTVNDYFLKTSYVTGQTSEGTTRIALYVEDQLVKYGAVAADGSYKIYASDALVLAGQVFKVVPFDANGTPGNATTSVVKTKDPAPKLGAPTINDYKLGTSYVTGTTVTGTKRIALYTNDVLVRYAVVAEDGTYKVWGKDALTNVDQTFEVRPYDADGIEGNPALSVVK